jgi:hypothetical protein
MEIRQMDTTATITLDKLTLANGSHPSPDAGLCIMEASAYFAGEPHSDAPKCVDPAIRRFLIALNDRMPDDVRQELKPYVLRVIGTATTDEAVRWRRAWLLVDWAAKHALPAALELIGAHCWADELRALPDVVDRETAWQTVFWTQFAREEAARLHAAADADAAYAAAYAAADAAYAAARRQLWLDLMPSIRGVLDRLIAAGPTHD